MVNLRQRYGSWLRFGVIQTIVLVLILVAGSGCAPLRQPDFSFAPEPSRIVDRHGEVIAALNREGRLEVPLDQISPYLQQAVVAVEDHRFYQYHGLDLIGLGRALVSNIKAGRVVEGGSTITQQTARTIYLSPERTLWRKVREAVLALQLELRYTKKEILELYLNRVYFGRGAYGAETAARAYFDKPAASLTLGESAMLAGVLRGPNLYSPFLDPDRARARQAEVLERMVAQEMITGAEAEAAKKEPLRLAASRSQVWPAAYFVKEIVDDLSEKYPDGEALLYSGGLTIETGLDLKMQKAAETAFAAGLAEADPELEGALVAIDPQTGYVRAMVGGRDYGRSQFNRATRARRQPGSAFKPFLYTAAIDQGFTPASMINCEPVQFPQRTGDPYAPTDYGDEPYHYRAFTLKEALKISDNVVAVRLNELVGPERLAHYAREMGISSEVRPFLSLALGTSEVTPLELARAYCPLANSGLRVKPILVRRVLDRSGNVIEDNRPVLEPVIDPRTAYIVTDMLQAVLSPGGTGEHLAPVVGRPAAGKTGTTQNRTDAWFVGYTPDLVTAVYIGFDSPSQPVGVSGGTIAGPIWANFTREALAGTRPREFDRPDGLVTARINTDTGLLASAWDTNTTDAVFYRGTEPTRSGNEGTWPFTPQSFFQRFLPRNWPGPRQE